MKSNAVIGMLLIVVVLVGTAFASDGWNVTDVEDYFEQFLVKESPGIYYPDIEIAEDLVELEYMSQSYTADDIWTDIDAILGSYWALVQAYPVAGDLYVKMNSPSGKLACTFSCKKSWVEGLDLENDTQVTDLYSKVKRTWIIKE